MMDIVSLLGILILITLFDVTSAWKGRSSIFSSHSVIRTLLRHRTTISHVNFKQPKSTRCIQVNLGLSNNLIQNEVLSSSSSSSSSLDDIDFDEPLEDYGEDDEMIDISSLVNHTEIGSMLKTFIGSWLDMKYGTGSPLHAAISDAAAKHYIQLRLKNANDLSQVALEIGKRLAKAFPQAEDESICVWDIAFNIYDAIRITMGGNIPKALTMANREEDQSITTSAENVTITNKQMEYVIDCYSPVLERYRLLREFFDGRVSWDTIQVFVALGMGFRPSLECSVASQVDMYTPPAWKNTDRLPNIFNDNSILQRMEADLPKVEASGDEGINDDALDMVLDAVLGTDEYDKLKQDPDPIIQRKIIISKWIYSAGLLVNLQFPPSTTYALSHPDSSCLPCGSSTD